MRAGAVLAIMLAAIGAFAANDGVNTGVLRSKTGGREVRSLNFGWTFENQAGETHKVDLPHDFLVEQPWVEPAADERADNKDAAANVRSRLSARGFKEMGRGVYTLDLFVPDSLNSRRVVLDFEGIMLVGDVYINGERAGGTDYGYLGFDIDATKLLKYGASNEIKVIADTGKPDQSRWYTGGGLYRDVNMVITSPDLYFNRHPLWITTDSVGASEAVVSVMADVNVARKATFFFADITLRDPDGNLVWSATDTVEVNPKWRNREYQLASLHVADPLLWDCDSPNLYTLDVTLRTSDGTEADSYSRQFGIRTIEYFPQYGFRLNGRKVLLKGIANHHTLGALGAAAYPRAMEKRIQLLKDFGFNHIRTSHNPYSESFLDLCDRYGILVVDEIYDKWLRQYAGGRREWTDLWQHDIPEWVRRDRNHPSVIMWSLGNELQGYSNLPYNDWGVTAYNLQKTLLRKYDTERPVTVAMHPRYRSLDTDSIPAPLALVTDIASYNYRYMYFPGDSRRYPHMIFYQSEANRSNMGPNFYEPDNDRVVGLAYWGMIDYLGESLGWPAKGWTEGVFDISLNPKPQAWMIKSMFTDTPTVRIGVVAPGSRLTDWNGVKIGGEVLTESWNHTAGDTLKIVTYTNCDEVALLVNGKEIGRRANLKNDPRSRGHIEWTDIVYAPGSIEAVGYIAGRKVDSHRIETAGEPVRLVAVTDNPDWRADGMDLQHVHISAVDKKGRVVPDATQMLTFEIEGPARLVAVSNGDMCSPELNTGNTRSLHQGRALAILRSDLADGDTAATVRLKVTAPGLRPITLDLTVR